MSLLKRGVVLFCCSFAIHSNAVSAEEFGRACRESPKVVDQCFTIRGRLIIYNGGWQLRIWPVGTKRLLAVVDPNGIWDDTTSQESGAPYMTPEVKKALNFGDNAVFADYTLCPLTKDIPEHMRHVCMVDAKNIVSVIMYERPF